MALGGDYTAADGHAGETLERIYGANLREHRCA